MSTETQVVAPKTLVDWHTPKSRTEGMEALIHSGGESSNHGFWMVDAVS